MTGVVHVGIVPYSGIGFGTFHTLKVIASNLHSTPSCLAAQRFPNTYDQKVLVAKKFYPEGMNAHSVEDEREQATQVASLRLELDIT